MDYSLIEARPGISVVYMPDAPLFTLVSVRNDFVVTTGISKELLIGSGFFTYFLQHHRDPPSTGDKKLKASFEQVIQNKQQRFCTH